MFEIALTDRHPHRVGSSFLAVHLHEDAPEPLVGVSVDQQPEQYVGVGSHVRIGHLDWTVTGCGILQDAAGDAAGVRVTLLPPR